MAIVIGPTPPGTGVIHEAAIAADGKSTSPTSFPSAFLSDGHHQDVSLKGNFPEVRRTGMGDSHRRILVQKQFGNRLSDYIASSDHHGVLSVDVYTGALYQFYDTFKKSMGSFGGGHTTLPPTKNPH